MKGKNKMEVRKNKKEDKIMKCKEKNYNPCVEDKELGRTRKMTCEICGRIFYDYEGGRGGRNPYPLKYDSCCPVCDEFIVQATRSMISEVRNTVEEGRGAELEEVLAERNRKREENCRRNKNDN